MYNTFKHGVSNIQTKQRVESDSLKVKGHESQGV